LGFDAFAQSFVEQFLSLIRVACSCGCLGFGRFAASDLRHRSHDKTICEITLRGRDGSSAVDVSLELLTASQVVRTHLLCALKSRMAGRRLLDVNYGFSAVLSADEEKVDRMDSRYLGFLSLKYSPASCFKSTCPADQTFNFAREEITIISAVAKTVPICVACQLVGEQQASHMRYLLASCLATTSSTSLWPHPSKPHALLVVPNLVQPPASGATNRDLEGSVEAMKRTKPASILLRMLEYAWTYRVLAGSSKTSLSLASQQEVGCGSLFIFPFPNPPVPPEASPLACTAQTSQTPTQDNPTTPTPVRVGVAGLSEAEPQATDAVRRDCNFLAVARLTSALRVDPLLQQRAASDEKRACTRHWHRGSIAHDSCTMLTMLENVKINGVESHDSVHLHQLILA
ncbi:hypothetical protein KCU75_g55, partial [Aureobasidium melanogenum]